MNTGALRVGAPAQLGWAMAAVGVVLFALYLVTLSPGVYPGVSASYVSTAMGFQTWGSAAHPLWRLFVSLWLRVPGCGGAWWLNLSSALWGAVAAALFCRYVARWVYATIGLGWEKKSGPKEVQSELTEDEAREARRASLVSVASGAFAAVLLGTGLAVWSASTRFQPETFDLMLVWAAFALYQDYTLWRGSWRLYALALLCGLGMAETTMFWVATPFLVGAMVAFLYRHHRLRVGLCLGLVGAGLLGLGLYWLSAHQFAQSAAGAMAGDWHCALRQLLKLQFREVALHLPARGWPFVLLLLVVPWLAFQMGYWWRLHRQRDFRADALFCVCLAVTVLLQFNAPLPPWAQWQLVGRLPVLEAALAAMLGGWSCAYWAYGVLFRWEPAKLIDGKEVRNFEKQIRLKRLLSSGMCLLLLALTTLAALCNGLFASGRRGAFADRCAQEILDQLGTRTWLVTDGVLDTHLAVLAGRQGQALHLLDLTNERDAAQSRRLRRWIEEEPRLQPYRAKLINAASLGVATFVREWLAADPKAETALALYGVPDFFTETGLTARPERFLFLATRDLEGLRTRPLLDEHRAFWKRLSVQLPLVEEACDPVDQLSNLLRRHLSLVANDLGVLLMDLGRPEDAYSTFAEALVLEPENLSAKLNRAILVGEGLHPQDKEKLEASIKTALAAFKRQPTAFEIVRAYGQIHSPQALASVGAMWARLGQYGLAQGVMERAASIAKEGGARTAIQASLGGIRLTARDTAQSEADFRSLLKAQPDNPSALIGMLNLALLRNDTADARTWLGKARQSGADATFLGLAEARIEIAEKKYDASCARLLELTDAKPQNLDAWALLAVAMIHQGRGADVERQVLPKMEAVAGKQANPLVFQVRGAVARTKGPASYGVARDAYRCALALMPGQRDVLEIVLELDLAVGDDTAAGRDANDLLRADRDNPHAHFVLGTQAMAHGEFETAEWHLRKSVASGASAEAWNNLAGILLKKGSLDEAEKAAREAVVKADKSAPFLDTLADVLLRRGKVAEAQTFIGKARSLAPQDWQVAFTAARILKQAGQPEEARVLLRQVQGHLDALPPPVQEEVARVAQEWKSRR